MLYSREVRGYPELSRTAQFASAPYASQFHSTRMPHCSQNRRTHAWPAGTAVALSLSSFSRPLSWWSSGGNRWVATTAQLLCSTVYSIATSSARRVDARGLWALEQRDAGRPAAETDARALGVGAKLSRGAARRFPHSLTWSQTRATGVVWSRPTHLLKSRWAVVDTGTPLEVHVLRASEVCVWKWNMSLACREHSTVNWRLSTHEQMSGWLDEWIQSHWRGGQRQSPRSALQGAPMQWYDLGL